MFYLFDKQVRLSGVFKYSGTTVMFVMDTLYY